MQLKETDERLAALYPGKYRAIYYELDTFIDGQTETRCGVYVDSAGWAYGQTFELAIEALKKRQWKITEEPQNIEG